MSFNLHAPYSPKGDQPEAIRRLVDNVLVGTPAQTLLGVTGSGKTFTMANVITRINRPTLILSHNKTLAAQLYAEFKEFFPNNAVEYFVSYYDYYQPEAYNPVTNIYIEKDLSINATIEKMRLRTTSSLLSERRDVVVIASVSCIYGMGDPVNFKEYIHTFSVGDALQRDDFLLRLVELFYSRTEGDFTQSTFRVRGDVVDLFLAYENKAYRFLFSDDEIEAIQQINPETGKRLATYESVTLFPASNFMVSKDRMEEAIGIIEREMNAQVAFFLGKGKREEAERLEQRTRLDMDMMRETGYCSGIENYSRCFEGRSPGERPYCLLDYFPDDFLMIIDESHVSIPQIRGMSGGDRARKRNLVDYGFRIPAAMDNRPLKLAEFEKLIGQVIYVSATPTDYEIDKSNKIVVEQVVRPTGLLDPVIELQPSNNQMDHLLGAIKECIHRDERVLVTTLTKRMAEALSKYLDRMGIRCSYMHSDVKTLDRVTILEQLRSGVHDVLVGVNLLREGLDLPEVSLVAILDADKEGFLRNFRSLIQTIGRAARNVNGKVIMYADRVTPSMERAIEETERRRAKQIAYNQKHGIIPRTVKKAKSALAQRPEGLPQEQTSSFGEPEAIYMSLPQIEKTIQAQKRKMEAAASAMDYIKAQAIQEEIASLQAMLNRKKSKPSH